MAFHLRSFWCWLLAAAFGLVPLGAQAVRVAAAADLRWALEEVRTEFEREHPGAKITITYGSSGTFHSQLRNRAPFDLFLSADLGYPQDLVARGLGVPDSLFTYGVGRLVLWVPKASTLDVEKLGLAALQQPSARKIALANPLHAPYGRAAEAALRKAGLWEKLQGRLVLGENISQTAQFVQSGSADIGFVALSLVTAGPMKGQGRWWLVPQDQHPSIEQGGVVLAWAQDPAAARAFRDFLASGKGAAILKQYGFGTQGP